MSSSSQKPEQNETEKGEEVGVDSLLDELRLLEVETFEIEDYLDLEQNMPGQWHSCIACSLGA